MDYLEDVTEKNNDSEEYKEAAEKDKPILHQVICRLRNPEN